MAVETAAREPRPTSRSPSSPDNQHAHTTRVPSEEELTSLFDEAMKRAPLGSGDPNKTMTKDEQTKFLKAMGDPEFRALLNEYMQEIADPAHRAETEQYLAQLEREQKVPEDKLLIKPTPGFVVKTKWDGSAKLFVNICSSEKLHPPSSTKVETGPQLGTSWSLPYSVGPERLEPDKSGGRVVTYDVCFHPRTLQFATMQKPYRDMVVKTCLDAVEPLVRKSQGKPDAVVSREYHVLKGVLYKSGEPVTMCLTTPSGGDVSNPTQSEETKKVERLDSKGSFGKDERKTIHHDVGTASTKPLIEEVSSTRTAPPASGDSASPKPLPKLEFRVVYRGKFEMLDHMQGTLNSHETPAQLPNRPRELVVEISFPTHSSAKGIDLDVNDRAVKVETAGYEPLEVRLPFAVVEEKGSAKFDKKARKLVVTLPVQPPEPAPVKRMAIVEQDDDEDDHRDDAVTTENSTLEEAATHTELQPQRGMKQLSVPKDDAFAMLREIALMVANDPMYVPRALEEVKSEPASPQQAGAVVPIAENEMSLEEKVKAHVAGDEVYDDLPPLESWSEDEDDIEMDLQDMFAMEAPRGARVAPTQAPALTTVPEGAVRIVRKTPMFAVKETQSCLSYLVEVTGVDASSVSVEYPSATSFRVRCSTEQEHFELEVDDLKHEIDRTRSEVHVASENVAIILYKANSVQNGEDNGDQFTEATAPPPVVRFQNDLLYDID